MIEARIEEQVVDAVVTGANAGLMGGGGTDEGVHTYGGRWVMEELTATWPQTKTQGRGIQTGEAVLTRGGALPADYVIHAVGPNANLATQRDPEMLRRAYREALARADELNLESVAFPLISAGVYSWDTHGHGGTAETIALKVLSTTPTRVRHIRVVKFTKGLRLERGKHNHLSGPAIKADTVREVKKPDRNKVPPLPERERTAEPVVPPPPPPPPRPQPKPVTEPRQPTVRIEPTADEPSARIERREKTSEGLEPRRKPEQPESAAGTSKPRVRVKPPAPEEPSAAADRRPEKVERRKPASQRRSGARPGKAKAQEEQERPQPEVLQDKRGQADADDLAYVFAPPAYTVRGTVGPHTSESVDGRLLDRTREMVLAQIPRRLHVEVTPHLDNLLNEQTFDVGFRQALADQLEIVLRTSQGVYVTEIALLFGDWVQVTDPRGNVLDPARHGGLHRQPGKKEVRIRQVDEFADPVGSSRAYEIGASMTIGINPSHGIVGREPLTSASGTATESATLLDAASARSTSTGVTTVRYVKGSSYRSVDFLYDVGVVVSVRKANGPETTQGAIVTDALLMRYSREATRRIPRPQGVTAGIDSAAWTRHTQQNETSTEKVGKLFSGQPEPEPEAPVRPPGTEDDIELGVRPRPDAAANEEIRQDRPPQAPPENAGLLDRLRRLGGLPWRPERPAGDRLLRRGKPRAVPRTSWVEAVIGADAFREAVFGVLDPALTVPGSESYQALSAFASVKTLHGGLHRMQSGLLSPVLFARDGAGRLHQDVVLVTAEVRSGRLDTEHQYDDFSRVDTEDVYVSGSGAPVTMTDALNTRGVPSVLLAQNNFTARISEALGWRRAVSQSRPGPFASAIQLFKWKFTGEPQSQSEHTVVYRAYSLATGRQREEQGGAVIRWLWQDAASDTTLAPQLNTTHRAPRPAPEPWLPALRRMQERHEEEIAQDERTAEDDREWAAALPDAVRDTGQRWAAERLAARDAARRRDPHRMLLMPETFSGWLPAFSRVSGWGDGVAVSRVLDRTVQRILEVYPAYLPGISLAAEAAAEAASAPGQSRIRFGPEWMEGFGNLMALWGALSPEELAGRLHKMVGGGDEIVLRAPRGLADLTLEDRHLVVRMEAIFDRRDFSYRRSLAGQMEIYYGNSWDLVGSTSRSNTWTVDVGNTSFTRVFGELTGAGIPNITGTVLPRITWSHTRAEAAGFSAGGAVGGGSDWMAEFDGAVTFQITFEEVRLRRVTPTMPGAFPADVEPGVVRESSAPWGLRVPTSLLVTEDLALEVVAPEQGDPYWAHLETAGREKVTTRDLYRLPSRSTLGEQVGGEPWTPNPASDHERDRVPQDALYVVDTSGLMREITAALTRLGVQSLSAQERVDLLAQVNSLGQRFRDHLNVPRRLWRTRLEWGPRSSTMVEIRVRSRLRQINPIGETDHAYRYLHAAATAQLRGAWTTDKIAPSIGVNVSMPVNMDAAATHVLNPLNVSGRVSWSNPHTSQHHAAGTADRVEIDIGGQFWGDLEVEWDVEVRVWDGGEPSIPWLENRQDPTVQRVQSTVDARGLVLMPRHHAVLRKLVDANGNNGAPDLTGYPGAASSRAWQVLAQSTKGGDPWALPGQFEELKPGNRLPPVNALRDGFGHGVVLETPEMSGLHDAVMTRVRDNYPAALAGAIENELGKITTLTGTRALLEDMLAGVSFLIPHQQLGVGWLVRMTVKAAVRNPKYEGPKPSQSVVERKNVAAQTHQVNHASSTSVNVIGQVGYTRNFSLDPDPARLPDAGTVHGIDVLGGATGSRVSGHSQSARTGYQESFGLLSITAPELIRLDVEFTVEFEHVWAPLGVLNLATLRLIRGYNALEPVVGLQENSLVLGFPPQTTRLDPRAAIEEDDNHEGGGQEGGDQEGGDQEGGDHGDDDHGDDDHGDDDHGDAPSPGGARRARAVMLSALRAVPVGLDPHPLRRTEFPLLHDTLRPGVGLSDLRQGMILDSTDLSEVDLESVAELARLRDAAKTLLGNSGALSAVLARLFGALYRPDTSWQGSTFRQQHRIDTVLTHSYLIRNVMSMLQGDGYTVAVPRDGWLWDADGYLSIAVDIRQLDRVDFDPVTRVTLDQTPTKDFERHATGTGYTRSFSHAVNPALTVTPKFRDNVHSLPTRRSTDPADMGKLVVDTRTLGTVGIPVTFAGGRTIATSSTVTAPGAQFERGDKTTGRDYTRLSANDVIWWFAYRPAMDRPARVVGVQIEDDALMLWAPTGQVPSLLRRVPAPAQPGADGADPVLRPRPQSYAARPATVNLAIDSDATLIQIKDLAAKFAQVAPNQEEEINRERFLLDAVGEAREAGADKVDQIAEPVRVARTRLNRTAQRLAALRFNDRERLDEVTDAQLLELHDRLQALRDAATTLAGDLAATEQLLRTTSAPAPITRDIAQLRQALETLDREQETRGARHEYLFQVLTGAATAGIDVTDLVRDFDAAARRATAAVGRGVRAREETADPDRVDVLSAHRHRPVLREEVDALRNLNAVITGLTYQLPDVLEPHRDALVAHMEGFEATVRVGRGRRHRARLAWLREWAAAARDRDQAAGAILDRLEDSERVVRQALLDAGELPVLELVEPDLVLLASNYERMRGVAAGFRAQREVMDAVEEDLDRDHHDLQPLDERRAGRLRTQLAALQRTMARLDAQRTRMDERFLEAQRWLDIAAPAGMDVTGLAAELGEAWARRAQTRADAETLRAEADVWRYTSRQVAAVHAAMDDHVAAEASFERVVGDILDLPNRGTPPVLQEEIRALQEEYAQLTGATGPEVTARNLRAQLRRHAAAQGVAELLRDLDAERASRALPRPSRASTGRDSARLRLGAAVNARESLRAAVEARQDHEVVVRSIYARARERSAPPAWSRLPSCRRNGRRVRRSTRFSSPSTNPCRPMVLPEVRSAGTRSCTSASSTLRRTTLSHSRSTVRCSVWWSTGTRCCGCPATARWRSTRSMARRSSTPPRPWWRTRTRRCGRPTVASRWCCSGSTGSPSMSAPNLGHCCGWCRRSPAGCPPMCAATSLSR
jgi:O-acetyl-ADP-ribose deacetylase (regulator of RNase III)